MLNHCKTGVSEHEAQRYCMVHQDFLLSATQPACIVCNNFSANPAYGSKVVHTGQNYLFPCEPLPAYAVNRYHQASDQAITPP